MVFFFSTTPCKRFNSLSSDALLKLKRIIHLDSALLTSISSFSTHVMI